MTFLRQSKVQHKTIRRGCSENLALSVTSKTCPSLTVMGLDFLSLPPIVWMCLHIQNVRVSKISKEPVSFKQISIKHSSVGGPGPLEMAQSLRNHTANQDCQPIGMFLIFLEIHTQFRLTWTPTPTSEWRVIRWLRVFTSGEQLAQMHRLTRWMEVTVLSYLTSYLSCSKFRCIEVAWGWNRVMHVHHEIRSPCLNHWHLTIIF